MIFLRKGNTLFILVFLLTHLFGSAQDKEYTREVIEKLCSPSFHGRGYYKQGDQKAAKYIAKEFSKHDLQYFADGYFQEYKLNINIISGDVSVRIDNDELTPGTEFLVASSSPVIHGTFPLYWDIHDSTMYTDPPSNSYFPVTKSGIREVESGFPYQTPGAIIVRDSGENMWWHVSNGREVSEKCLVIVRSDKISENSGLITLNIESEYDPQYLTQNVIGYIEGSAQPDSFIVFTAHYDHLGRMGKDTYFPGANDNASGTAMVIDLARHFSEKGNQPECSVVFIAFSGEEAGLEGSLHFAGNPLFPLSNIKALVNLDMVGTGDEGITVVNGAVLKKEFNLLEKINKENKYLKEVKSRGESCNSDHCPFYMKGVPAMFIYSRSNVFNEYHSLKDSPENLPLNGYDGLFRLLVDFTKEL